MKKYFSYLMILSLFWSCFTKQIVKKTTLYDDSSNSFICCSGPEFESNRSHFMSQGIGESLDQSLSKKKALSFARADLVQILKTTLDSVLSSYLSSLNTDTQNILKDRFYGIQREVIKGVINHTNVVCENLTKTASGKFKTYIAIEKSSIELMNEFNSIVMTDLLLKECFESREYEKYFFLEMKKLDTY